MGQQTLNSLLLREVEEVLDVRLVLHFILEAVGLEVIYLQFLEKTLVAVQVLLVLTMFLLVLTLLLLAQEVHPLIALQTMEETQPLLVIRL
jgi:hypothetical protein